MDESGTEIARSSHAKRSRGSAVRARWGWVLFYGAFGAGIWWLIAPYFDAWTGPVLERRAEPHPSIRISVILGLSCGITLLIARGRWKGCLGVRHILTFPPLWVAAVLGVAGPICLSELSQGTPVVTRIFLDPAVYYPYAWFSSRQLA